MKGLLDGMSHTLASIARAKDLHHPLCVILPLGVDRSPGIKNLVLACQQLDIDEICVVIQENDEVQFSMRSATKKGLQMSKWTRSNM